MQSIPFLQIAVCGACACVYIRQDRDAMWSVLHSATIKTATFFHLNRERNITAKGTARSSGQLAAYPMEQHKDFTVANVLSCCGSGQLYWLVAPSGWVVSSPQFAETYRTACTFRTVGP
jgi:hypothetical protein